MSLEKEKVSNSQYMILIIGFLQGSVLVLSFMDSIAKQDAWIVILASLLLCIPIILSYVYLSKWFPGKSLVEICDAIFGRVLGKAITVLYIVYFLLILSFNLKDLADFYTGFIMTETPKIVFLVIFVLVAGYALKKGISTIAKISLFSTVFAFTTMFLDSSLLIGKMDFSNFLPVFQISLDKFFQAISHFVMVPYCEIVVFLLVAPSLKSTGKIGRYTVWGLLLATVSFLLLSIRNTAVLGVGSSIIDMASYESTRLINISGFISRVELLIAFGFTFSLFIKICVIYFATVKSISQSFKMESYTPLILPVGGIAIILSLITYDSTISHIEFAVKYNVPLFALFLYIFPPLSLLIARLRKLNKTGKHKTVRVKA